MKFTIPVIALIATFSVNAQDSFFDERPSVPSSSSSGYQDIPNYVQNSDWRQKFNETMNQAGISEKDREKINRIMDATSCYDPNSNTDIMEALNGNSTNPCVTTYATGYDVKCQTLIQKYYDCLPQNLNKNNYEKSCEVYNSDECKSLLKRPLSDHTDCKNAQADEENIAAILSVVDLSCGQDGRGEYCPITKLNMEGKRLTRDAVKDTCYSDNCYRKAISSFSNPKLKDFARSMGIFSGPNGKNEFNNINDVLDILNDSDCTENNNVPSSSPLTAKIGSSLLFTAALFLYYFF
ncbi:hypothetical protein H8356DRAFT_1049203 [Neocallimastix lanati (nom. inval.)]|jgi:hypothetical protein|uniref:Uncharacterized protein n=1 Tax=Neocallimastix californiae TaxID=1754190 RepID=A0A1Y1YRM2_9FUNG|nr:hypothetical protein H8356DRAFT_1049203 [Neocallimastix sp. JGI-2020a]ORY00397.1 hypothetical protein LY90DRAFT_709507 [Neocallimastix californiae]|eukprot:ORY00397.1 hypothetical protein LY90DRAFT_709507 [Neocallimastix californiae]